MTMKKYHDIVTPLLSKHENMVLVALIVSDFYYLLSM